LPWQAAPFAQQGFVELAPVGNAGETIEGRQAGEFLVGVVELAGQHQQRITHLGDALHGRTLAASTSRKPA
jgi:hypothetical protein